MLKREQAKALKVIQKCLSTEFKFIDVKSVDMIPDLSDIILYSKKYIVKAKFVNDGTNYIHIKFENTDGFIYEFFCNNYIWFIKAFSFDK